MMQIDKVPKKAFDMYRIETYDPYSPVPQWKEFIKMMSKQKCVPLSDQLCGVTSIVESAGSANTLLSNDRQMHERLIGGPMSMAEKNQDYEKQSMENMKESGEDDTIVQPIPVADDKIKSDDPNVDGGIAYDQNDDKDNKKGVVRRMC